MPSILLATESPIKFQAVRELFGAYDITCIKCDELNLPPQPVNCSAHCAKARLNYAREKMGNRKFDLYIAIENGIKFTIVNSNETVVDVCSVVIESGGVLAHSEGSIGVNVPTRFWNQLCNEVLFSHAGSIKGYDITVGDLMYKEDPTVDTKNWYKHVGSICRSTQILDSLEHAHRKLGKKLEQVKVLNSKYKTYQDYPKPGVLFLDFFSIIKEQDDIQMMIKLLSEKYMYDHIHYVVGLESRGFFGFGLSVSNKLGFIPARKKGKLPGELVSITYTTEYSTDTIEIHKDIPKGSRVIVFDDLIATGGSMRAVCDLLSSMGCVVVDCVVLREVLELRQAAQEKLGRSYTVLLQDQYLSKY